MSDLDTAQLRSTLDAFDAELPIERAWTPPSEWYTTEAIHRLESRAVWGRSWQLAALSHQVRDAGNFVAVEIADQPVVVTRGKDGVLRAFHNVCRHKAALVASGAGCAEALVCPYHGWRYRLDGRLAQAQGLAGIRDFDAAASGLLPLQVEEWGPWVFVNADLDAEALGPQVAPLHEMLEASGWGRLRYHGARTWQVGCNWKAFCDNYLDGGYHIPHMHPSLEAQLDMGSYRTEIFERFNVQRSSGASRRIGAEATYGWVYPNFMLNRYGPVLDINVVRPLGPERCEVLFAWWFDPDCDPGFIEASVAQTAVTQEEDVAISERVQRGLRSPGYTSGRYAPRLETGIHHFHRLLAADLRA